MAKMRKVFFIFLLLCAQLFGAYEAQLLNFDKNFASSSNKQDFHHQLKNLYIQSIINEDEKSKIEILKRLVISSNALNLDDKGYVKELVESGVKESEIKTLQAQNKQTPAKTNTQEKPSTKTTQEKSSSDIKQNPKTQNEAEKKRFVLQAKQEQNNIILSLNQELKQQELRISELKEKQNYRYIIDFKAALDTGRKEFKTAQARILLAQFDPQTTRLVIYAEEKPDFNLKFDKNSFELEFKDSQNKSNQTAKTNTSTTKQTQNKTQTPQKTSQAKENKAQKKLFVLKSTKETNGIKLTLNDELNEYELQIFQMKDKDIYRVVINFEGVLEGKRKNFNFKNTDISLTQYTPKIVRVVLSSKQEIKLFKELDKKNLFLGFSAPQTNAKTQTNTNASKTNSNTKTTQNKQNQATQTSSKNTISRANAKNKIIVIDAGHGGKDGGAVGGGGKLLEKNIVLSVALKLGEELKSKGYKVFYTRTSDKFINLRDRTKIANEKKANLFISIHANAAPNASKAKTMQGLETFFLSPARSERSKEVAAAENKSDLEEANFFSRQNFLHSLSREKIIASNRLAIDIQKNLLSKVRTKYKVVDGAVREAPFWVLVGAQDMPAVLIEIGYISHPEEGKRLASKNYQELLAQGMAAGVDSYFANNP